VPIVTSKQVPAVADGERLVFHILSAMEDLSLDPLWPRWAQDPAVGLVVTIFDMIPALYPDEYFQGPLRHRLESRYRLIREADAVIAISYTTAKDACRLLGLDERRLFVVYGSVGGQFLPHPGGRSSAHQELALTLNVKPDFLLSIGNVDPRKNLLRLMQAYAILPEPIRHRHQLVVTCSQGDSNNLEILRGNASDLGIADDVVLTGFVDDATMVRLYQACHTMVFPSLYEGLGLPLIEAMRCGAATVASDVGSMREIINDPLARFDPYDVQAVNETLRRVLTDDLFVSRRRAAASSDSAKFGWSYSAEPAVDAYHFAARQR
jgi:glycosyltransferase involved in cell wall biosynthesis